MCRRRRGRWAATQGFGQTVDNVGNWPEAHGDFLVKNSEIRDFKFFQHSLMPQMVVTLFPPSPSEKRLFRAQNPAVAGKIRR